MISIKTNRVIGISDGSLSYLFKEQTDRYLEQYTMLYSLPELNGVELVWLHKDWWDVLIKQIQTVYSGKRYISLHLSCPLVRSFEHEGELIGLLYAAVKQFRVQNIVVHADWAREWGWLKDLNDLPISIENTDHLCEFGGTPDDVEHVMGDFRLTLDLQHCFDNDHSGDLMRSFHARFLDRIVEFHVSGWDAGEHTTLYSMQDLLGQNMISNMRNILHDSAIPVIIESCCKSISEYKSEIKYITEEIRGGLCST